MPEAVGNKKTVFWTQVGSSKYEIPTCIRRVRSSQAKYNMDRKAGHTVLL